MSEVPKSDSISTKQLRIATVSSHVNGPLYNLSHYIDSAWMQEAFKRTRKNGAVGIDKQTSEDFESDLTKNLGDLISEAKSGSYRAPPGRRVMIPKANGKERAIAVPCFRDKVLQRSVVMVLEPIYERIFYDFSYGFRSGKNAKQACGEAREHLKSKGGYLIEADIKSYFDTISHAHLREMLSQRVSDGVIRKLIDKWLKAGVFDGENHERSSVGSVQGGVISPLLSNIYLHYVLDEWFHEDVKPRLTGKANLIRFADDFVIACESRQDAERLLAVLHKRFAKFGLELHSDKTRITSFLKPPKNAEKSQPERSGTWTFLGFTFYWAKSRKGYWVVKLKTSKESFSRALNNAKEWCWLNRHKPVVLQYKNLMLKIRGHQGYFRVIGNHKACANLEYQSLKVWKKWLSRRSREGGFTFSKFNNLLASLKYLAPPLPPIAKV